jgi:hypothetical protein
MKSLNLPNYTPKISKINGKQFIYDIIRRKNVALTPDEWVRQHFVNYLITEKNYPKERIANEVTVSLNGMSKRCDTVVYNQFLEPIVIVEYKAPSVPITQDVIEQITRYNICLRVSILIVTNGLEQYCFRIDYETLTYSYLKEMPGYDKLITPQNART